jgi:hypothetical protein
VPLHEALQLVDQIWSFGPRKARTNLLFTRIEHFQTGVSVWRCLDTTTESPTHRVSTDSESGINGSVDLSTNIAVNDWPRSVVNGFYACCLSGPICDEPLRCVGFVMDACIVSAAGGNDTAPLAGQLVSTTTDVCRRAFQVCARAHTYTPNV